MFNERWKLGIRPFGSTHLIVLLILVCIAVAVVLLRGFFVSNSKADKIFRWGVAFLAVGLDIGYSLWSMLYIKNSWTDIVPLEFCSVAMWITVIGVLTKNQKLLRVAFFWGLTGPIMALMFVEVKYVAPHFRFFHYFLWHFAILLLNIYMYATGQVKLRFRDSLWSCLWLSCIGIVNFCLNPLLGTNFMFLVKLPGGLHKVFAPLGRYGFIPLFGLAIFVTFQAWYWLTVLINRISVKLFANRTAEAYL